MNSSDTEQTKVLVLRNHDSWKCDQPSSKAGLSHCVKYWPVHLPGSLLHDFARKGVKLLCVGRLLFQVEHVHPSPGGVWFRGSVPHQDPGPLLPVPLFLQPAVSGIYIQVNQNKKILKDFLTFSISWLLDCLKHWWENRHNMEEMAWLQWWGQHGPWIFWVGGWVLTLYHFLFVMFSCGGQNKNLILPPLASYTIFPFNNCAISKSISFFQCHWVWSRTSNCCCWRPPSCWWASILSPVVLVERLVVVLLFKENKIHWYRKCSKFLH